MHTQAQIGMYELLASYSEVPVYKHGSNESRKGIGYLALGIVPQSVANTNAVSILSDGSVRFFTHDDTIIKRLEDLGYHSEPLPHDKPRNEFGHDFYDLTTERVRACEPELRQLVRDPVRIVTERHSPNSKKRRSSTK